MRMPMVASPMRRSWVLAALIGGGLSSAIAESGAVAPAVQGRSDSPDELSSFGQDRIVANFDLRTAAVMSRHGSQRGGDGLQYPVSSRLAVKQSDVSTASQAQPGSRTSRHVGQKKKAFWTTMFLFNATALALAGWLFVTQLLHRAKRLNEA